MKDFKGTKGKWISRYNGNYWEVNREEDFEDGKRLAISVMVFETKDGNLVFSRSGEAIANAKLIAAAPEMLQALQSFANGVRERGYAGHLSDYLKQADTIISKALGKEADDE